ncbi:MAG: 50S ribosomal protein L6 [Clostridiales bacterium]|jgi:large subunit ribosomal protein L6|nr:50S ribosomal protein L6 [Clostridiales bacterium]
MSRIGKLPISVPKGVTVTVDSHNTVVVKGPKGTLTQQVNPDITIKQENGILTLERPTDAKPHKAMHGLYRSLLHNMVVGVTDGFEKTLELVGTGYRAAVDGNKLTLNVGYSHPIVFEAPKDITFSTPSPTQIVVQGIDKQVVGNLAADIRATRKPEPYHGKGVKYRGEQIRRKVGKAGSK